MIIPRDPFDRKAQDTLIAETLAKAENTAIYLDTSSLVWMYRLSHGARVEFIEWATIGSLKGKVHIPAWALHELHKHRGSMDTLFPARSKVGAVERELQSLTEAASLFVDDKLAGAKSFSDRAQYLKFLDDSKSNLVRALKVLKDVDVSKVEEHLIPFFESSALNAISPELGTLQSEFLARSEGRIPPGYKDAKKKGDDGQVGGDGANRFGDFAFWKEILLHATSNSTSKVIIITHDAKPDWVFAPQRYIDYNSKIYPNSAKPKLVTCPHPTLSTEASSVAGVKELYILTIPQLIQLISTHGEAKDVQKLAEAVQIEQEASDARSEDKPSEKGPTEIISGGSEEFMPDEGVDDHSAGESVPDSDLGIESQPFTEPNATSDSETIELLNSLSAAAIADADYEALGGGDTPDSIIRQLKSYDWYQQNPAVRRISASISNEETTPDQVFILARNLYQAACGNSSSAMRMMDGLETFLKGKPAPIGELFFAGLLFEAYFDASGNLRSAPKGDYLKPLFISAETERFEEEVRWLRERISADVEKFIRLPGDGNSPDIYSLVEDDGKVIDIQYRGVSLVETGDDEFGFDELPRKCSERRLKEEIASHFATLEGYVSFGPTWTDEKKLSHLKFISWGPRTNIQFPKTE